MTRFSFEEFAKQPKNQRQKNALSTGKATIYVLLLAAVMSACAPRLSSHGHMIDPMELEQIVPGESNRDDVLDILGNPSFSGAFNEDKYYYVSQMMEEPVGGYKTSIKRTIFVMSFDENDILQTIDIRDEATGINVITLDAKTPTPGDNFGVLEQIFGNLRRASE
ncbi:MAG: outer membrane protein assembly factor BamE [Candidatus Puniceispirillaceae bacterium]